MTTVMHLVSPGRPDRPVADVYAGTCRIISQVYEPKGYGARYAPAERIADRAHLDNGRGSSGSSRRRTRC